MFEFLVLNAIALLFLFFALLIFKSGFNTKTPKIVAIAISHFLILALRIDDVFLAVNDAFAFNHLSWLIIVFAAYAALLITNSLFTLFGQPFPYRYFKVITYSSLGATLLAFLFVSQSPADVGGVIANTFSQRIFMLVYFSYSFYLSLGLWVSVYRLQREEKAMHHRFRWLAIFASLTIYSCYYIARLVYVFADHVINTQLYLINGLTSYLLMIMCITVLFIFMPSWFYKKVVVFSNYLNKVRTLFHLAKVTKKLGINTANARSAKLTFSDFFNIDFRIYINLISILDFKFYLKTERDLTRVADKNCLSQIVRVDDSNEYDQLINTYSRIGRFNC